MAPESGLIEGRLLKRAEGRCFTHVAFPDSAAPRLMIPTEPKIAKASLRFFFTRYKRVLLHGQGLICRLGNDGPRRTYDETALLHDIKALAGCPDAFAAVSPGTAGPYSKPTVLLLDAAGVAVALAKVATNPRAERLLRREADWLARLAQTPELTPQVPRLMVATQVGATYVLVQSAGGSGHCLARMPTASHLRFLSVLQETDTTFVAFRQSPMSVVMRERHNALSDRLDPDWARRSEIALSLLDEHLGSRELPMVAAHRDFVRWNMRRGPAGPFVFDWEYASTGYVPFYDLFHFVILPTALRRNVTVADAGRAIREVVSRGRRLRDAERKVVAPEAQLLAYLLDRCLFYLESNDGNVAGDHVVRRYAWLIDRFELWSRG